MSAQPSAINPTDSSNSSDPVDNPSDSSKASEPNLPGTSRRLSIVRTITRDVENELKTIPSLQESEVEHVVGPLEPEFWRPDNIMSVEDTPFSKRYLVSLEVVFFSILGNMARVGMTKLTSYDNEYAHFYPGTCLWSNFTACFVMAWCNHAVSFWQSLLQGSGKTNMKQMALHSGITAGFCGSFSTWSSLLIEVLFKTIDYMNGGHRLPNHGYGVMEFFSVLLIQMGVSFLGYYLGKDVAALIDLSIDPEKESRVLNYRVCRVFELTTAFLGVGVLIANIVLACTLSLDNFWKSQYAVAILFGAVGAWLRFRLSKYNGSFGLNWFPSGTLMANIIACTLIAVFYVLLYGIKNSATGSLILTSQIHRVIVGAFSTGFCGSLSTTSSFVNELYNLQYPFQRYRYFFITFLSCFILMFLIICPYAWTKGFSG